MKYIIILILIILIILIILKKKEHYHKINFKLDKKNKLEIKNDCKFSGHGFDENSEIGECSIAIQLIPYCKNVIEIGGGTGKVSHIINKMLKDKTQHIVIEPGSKGLGNHGDISLEFNKNQFKDKYKILKKFANDLTMNDLSILKEKPDCLYVDCEGCLYDFQNTEIGKYILSNIRYVVNEMDGYNKEIKIQWEKYGFKHLVDGYGCGTDCITEIWEKN